MPHLELLLTYEDYPTDVCMGSLEYLRYADEAWSLVSQVRPSSSTQHQISRQRFMHDFRASKIGLSACLRYE